MMNRFIIDRDDFFANDIDNILKRLKMVSIDRSSIHLIINGASVEDLDLVAKNINLTRKFRIYKSLVSISSSDDILRDSTSYISDVDEDSLVENIALYYLQQLDGWSGLFPIKNSLVIIDRNLDLFINQNKIGSLYTGIEFDSDDIDRKYIGLNGFCFKCLNPLCNHNKMSDSLVIKNFVNENECTHKMKLLNKVPMEVQEVTKQQMTYILEVLTEVMRNSDTSVNVLGELINKLGDK